MRISKVSIDGFGLFDSRFAIELSRDVSLIVGDNETGKSTIVAAIGAILFGLERESEKAFYAPFGLAGPGSGSLDVEVKDKTYRFVRDFASNHAKVELVGKDGRVLFDGSAKPGGRTEEKEAYNEVLRDLFGFESRELFYNSVFVEQNSLPAEMKTVVRRIVSGSATADYAIVLKNLKETCEELTIAVPWKRKRKPGRVEALEGKLQQKKARLAEARRNETEVEELGNRIGALEAELKKLAEHIASEVAWERDLTAFSTALEKKAQTEEALNRCRKEREEVEKLRGEIRKCSEMQVQYPKYASLPPEAEQDIASLARYRESQQQVDDRLREIEAQSVRQALGLWHYVAALVGLLIVGMGTIVLDGFPRIATVAVGIAGAAWPAYSAIRAHISLRRKVNELGNQLLYLTTQIEKIQKDYPMLAGKRPSEALDQLHEYERLCVEKEKKEEALRQHPESEELGERYHKLSNELILASDQLKALKERRPGLADIETEGHVGKSVEDAQVNIEKYRRKRDELNKEREAAGYERARAEATQDVPVEALEDEIAERQSELDRLKLLREAHLTAIKMLEEALSEFGSSHLERIERKTSEYLGRITGERCRVRLDDNLEPLGIERAGQHLQPDQLSKGTRDQLFFSLRLAAIEEICGERPLPILLDDPFVNFDETRLNSSLRTLEELGASHQVVLLTHDKRCSTWRQPALTLNKR